MRADAPPLAAVPTLSDLLALEADDHHLDTGALVERRAAKSEEIAAYEAGRQARLF